MLVALIINYFSVEKINELLLSFKNQRGKFDLILIVNNSEEECNIFNYQSLKIHIINSNKNLGFGKACNLGLNWIYQQDSSAIVWLINPDTKFLSANLEQLRSFVQTYSNISILGTTIYSPDNKIWFGGGYWQASLGRIYTNNSLKNYAKQDYINCDWISGCSLIINLTKFKQCPEFDSNYFLYYEDFDFCRRYAELGHEIAITDKFRVLHYPSSITNRNIYRKEKHSTYSYLLTLQKYTNFLVFSLLLLKLFTNTIFCLLFKPNLGKGKLAGIVNYYRRKKE